MPRKRNHKHNVHAIKEVVIFSYQTSSKEVEKKNTGFKRLRHGVVAPYKSMNASLSSSM